MASEKRLIDANAFKVFLEDVRQCYLEEDTFSSNFAAELIETVQDNYLDLAPTVDAVEVVRCKDCKHWHEETGFCEEHSRFDSFGMDWNMFAEDDFCSYGERRTDERKAD